MPNNLHRFWDRLFGLKMSLLPTTVVESRTPTTSSFDVLKRVCLIITSLVILVCFLILVGQIVTRLVFSSPPSYIESSNSLHYAIVIDAGSSGSRAYLYAWPTHSGNPHDLLKISPLTGTNGEPLVKKAEPGLSSFSSSPSSAFAYIRPLLEFAESHIPPEQYMETPLYILATAGMRLIEKAEQEAIMENLRQGIAKNFQFHFPDSNLEIISGKQEGIYQWLAINYVLGKFKHQNHEGLVAVDHPSEDRKSGGNLVFRPRTVGAIDMGGASMQIAMEITSDLQMEGMTDREKSQVTELNIGCTDHDTEHTYRVFVTTFLGYGANEALARHRRNQLLSQFETNSTSSRILGLSRSDRLSDPCLPFAMTEDVKMSLDFSNLDVPESARQRLTADQQVFLSGTGHFEECVEAIKDFTKTRDPFLKCGNGDSNCPDAGIKVPAIQMEDSEFYGFSEFWYSMEDVLRMGGPYLPKKFKHAAKSFCSEHWQTTWQKFVNGEYPQADEPRMKTQCFKSAWLTVAIHEGFAFPKNYGHLSAAPNTVNGNVVHWTVGALLYRTRFFPLRAIESKDNFTHGQYHSFWESGYLYSHYIVLICLILVIAAILLYLRRLRRYVQPNLSLRKVASMPSMSFWHGQPSEDAELTTKLIRPKSYQQFFSSESASAAEFDIY